MKLKIIPYNKNVSERFKKEKKKILRVVRRCKVWHIGSTATPGLGGKGIVDIMLGIKNWKYPESTIKKLKKIGFKHIHSKEKGRIFLSKNKTLSLGNIHIHIVKIGSKTQKEILYFRDYLRKNKKEAERYFNFKKKWLKESCRNRKKYKKLKSKYINKVLYGKKLIKNNK
ncbi:GrpB family protein [Patescibacteria group bacterium]|nr:GrpB family protein [Patescibacteria group bacterium]MBU4368041.1 GrpB family protein [Patescibacteria group bacterium]MBU4462212.1 GrpB family protein [Patescibacteria group bacterium]MCG2699568.1 GrpB family protein [Candidatus Parcubacteria bacterium]